MNVTMRKIKTELGSMYLVASDHGLQGVFYRTPRAPSSSAVSTAQTAILDKAEKQIKDFIAGRRTEFDLPLDAQGTPFQKRVWSELSKIPYGKTCSYKDIARKLNAPNASRAVGTANGRNPLSIIVPCHRVVTSGGKLGGYAGGLDLKEKLLALEGLAFKR